METQQQTPNPFQPMSQEAPGQMIHHPRVIPPELLAQMREDAMPIHQTMPITPTIAPGKKDYTPLYVGTGLISALMICGTVMVAIANSPNAQTERVAMEAVQSSALVAKTVAERPTCRAIGLIVMKGACPESTGDRPSAATQPVDNGVVPYTAIANNAPLPAEVPTNPYAGLDNASLQIEWNNNGCNASSATEVCSQIMNAAQ